MANNDIRKALKEADIRQWQLAEKLHISEWTLIRRFRHELSDEQKEKVFTAIEKLKKEQN